MKTNKRNPIFFGLGTVGRDMFYTLESMFLTVYLTEVLDLSSSTFAALTAVLTILRIFDAFNDPFMGLIVDNTRSRFGKFKPCIVLGGLSGGIVLLIMFTDLHLSSWQFVLVFGILYLLWDIAYGLNDIAYWSMLPALSTDKRAREKAGSLARFFASIGMFLVVVGVLPITQMLTDRFGNAKTAWFVFAAGVVVLMWGFQIFTVVGVREDPSHFKEEEKTSLKEMFKVLIKNDQLMIVAASMGLFMIGYTTTAVFGPYYFKYLYGNEDMYSVFAAVLGVSQLSALLVFPLLAKRLKRRTLYAYATGMVAFGYIGFVLSPMNIFVIGSFCVVLFVGQAFIQILMLMFLSDTIEYGQLKLGKRNESITFSVQPFINKIASALANGILGLSLILSGIKTLPNGGSITARGAFTVKAAMMIAPLCMIGIGFLLNRAKYKLNEQTHLEIVQELEKRGDIRVQPD
jgi:melibiose permease/lactose/raffinose/galactose permease